MALTWAWNWLRFDNSCVGEFSPRPLPEGRRDTLKRRCALLFPFLGVSAVRFGFLRVISAFSVPEFTRRGRRKQPPEFGCGPWPLGLSVFICGLNLLFFAGTPSPSWRKGLYCNHNGLPMAAVL